MKIFTETPIYPSRCPKKVFVLRDELAEVIYNNSDINDVLKLCFKLLGRLFPLDYLLLCNPIGHSSTLRYNVYAPGIENPQVIQVNMTEEQRQVITQGSSNLLLRIADQDDQFITLNRFRRWYPDKPFSMLFMRNIIAGKHVSSISLVSKKANIYSEMHAAWMFVLSDTLATYWNTVALNLTQPDNNFPQGNYLPLKDLPGMQKVLHMVWSVSRQDCPVLLLGETGTGKEIVADTIYRGSVRHSAPFIKINCGGIPDTLVDSELFGHEKGSFTSAISMRRGVFERADQGVLLLDELGELPLTAQSRLLRVLQEGIITRVGGDRDIHVDVRVIAATHRDMNVLVERGQFRQDLLYRLNIFPVYIPALRERPADIPILLNYFIYKRCIRYGALDLPKVSTSELKRLCAYPWPGNIRELQNTVDRAVILWLGNKKDGFNIMPEMGGGFHRLARHNAPAPVFAGLSADVWEKNEDHSLALDDVVTAHIRKVVQLTRGKVSGKNGAAALMRINPNTLRAKMRKYKIFSQVDDKPGI